VVGPVVDIRGTPEAVARANALEHLLSNVPAEILTEELGAP
jgi:hypothetical protein